MLQTSGVDDRPVYPAFPLVIFGCALGRWSGRYGDGVVQTAEQFVEARQAGVVVSAGAEGDPTGVLISRVWMIRRSVAR
jgi:hypothetical protein